MATTYFKTHHISKGEIIAQSMKDRFDYGQNPNKTRGGKFIAYRTYKNAKAKFSSSRIIALIRVTDWAHSIIQFYSLARCS